MRFISICMVTIFASSAFSGTFLDKGIHIETALTVGLSKTLEAARNDARESIPAGFEISTNKNSPAIQCAGRNVWSERKQCGEQIVRYVLPIHKVVK